MDHLEGSSRITPGRREQQFLRLRERLKARAARKFQVTELEGNPPGVILRGIDFPCRGLFRLMMPKGYTTLIDDLFVSTH